MQEVEKLLEQAEEMVKNRSFKELKTLLCDLQPQDIAALLSDMDREPAAALFRLLPKDQAAEVLVELDSDQQAALIGAFTDKELAPILDEMFLDDMADLVEEMPAGLVKKILKNTDPESRKTVNDLLKYPKDSAGTLMTPEFVDLKKNMTVRECFDRIRATGPDKETVYTCYVTDEHRRILGVVSVKDLLLASQDKPVSEIMETNVITVRTTDDKEEIAHDFDKYDFLALPVIDGEDRLVGIVTFDDAMDVLQEENTEDFEKMAAITPSEKGYFEVGVFTHAKNRILWLLVLMVSATLTGNILTRYETAFAAIPVLVAMIPMLMDTGGNCGSQASTMVIRGLALGDMKPRDFFRVWFKEIRIALVVGAALAVINFGRVLLFYSGQDQVKPYLLAAITSLTLFLVVLVAKSLGTALPMLAKRVGLDPAIMASPLITTVVDACSVLLFFSIACAVLGLTI
ncbi:MAG: magnesium transporter [Clostridia bacterium]|nr:magnesium transporter [Clostridia bacterium]